MSCEKCLAPRESPLHFITQCEAYSNLRLIMLNQVKQYIPNILVLAKKRQYEILVHGYDPENDDLVRYNTKILIATQKFMYDTKRFRDKKNPLLLLLNLLFLLLLICLLLLFKSSIVACKLYSLELKTGQCGVRDPLHL